MSAEPRRGRVAIVHGALLEEHGFAERTLAWLRGALHEAGAWVDVIVPGLGAESPSALATYERVVLGDVGGTYGELAFVGAVARLPPEVEVIVVSHGFPFCVDGSRLCGPCPLRLGCPSSDRVSVYRRLARRASRVLYHSPSHRELSEAFLGAHPEKTEVIGPVALPALAPASAELDRVAFPRTAHPEGARKLIEEACRAPDRRLVVYGALPPGLELPPNVQVVRAPAPAARTAELSRAQELLCMPSEPLPFGEDAAAMIAAGRRVTLDRNVGLTSFPDDLTDASRLRALVQASQARLLALCGGGPARATPPRGEVVRPSWLGPGRRVLVWAHHLGLGDSINLLPLLQALEGSVGAEGLRSVLPAVHAGLLRPSVEHAVIDGEAFDLAAERARAELVIEITIRRSDAYAGDVYDERWLPFELERQPLLFSTVHENLLSALHRAGLAVEPRRPRLGSDEPELARARQRLASAGVELGRDLLLAVHPGAGGAHKRWPVERFATLAQRARDELGAQVVLITGPGEAALAQAFGPVRLHSRADPLRELSALLGFCHTFAGNDSGLMHLACAAGCPALALFGPSAQHLWGPSHPSSVVVAAHDAEGRRSHDLRRIEEAAAFDGLIALLRRVATALPAHAHERLVPGPRLQVEAEVDAVRYVTPLGALRVRARDGHDPVSGVLRCLPAPWSALATGEAESLLDLALAAGVIAPSWAGSAGLPALLYVEPPRHA